MTRGVGYTNSDKRTHSDSETTMKAPEQTIRLADTANFLHRLASIEIKYKGEYFCMVDGKRTRVIA